MILLCAHLLLQLDIGMGMRLGMRFVFYHSDRISSDIKEARSAATAIDVESPEEVLLSVTCDLSRSSSLDEVSRDSSPVSLSDLLQSNKEQLMLLFRPRYPSLALGARAGGVMNGVIGGGVTNGHDVFLLLLVIAAVILNGDGFTAVEIGRKLVL